MCGTRRARMLGTPRCRLGWLPLCLILLLGSCGDRDPILALSGKARAEAKRWQSDAVMVEIEAGNFLDVVVEGGKPVMKSGPPKVISFHFFSPATRQALTVSAVQEVLQSRPEELPGVPFTLPLPNSFVGLDAAIAAAKTGMGDGIVTSADLRIYWKADGQPDKPVWMITFGQDPKTAKSIARQIDAVSGAVTTVADLSKEPENRGTVPGQLPPGLQRNFTALRQVADAAAAQQGSGFKLYNVNLLIDISALHNITSRSFEQKAADLNGKVPISEAHFAYARATPTVDWESLNIDISNLDNPPPAMSLGPITRRTPPQVQPRFLPPDSPDPEPRLRRLQLSFPRGGAWSHIYYSVAFDPAMTKVGLGFDDATPAQAWLSRQGDPWENHLEWGPAEDQYAVFATTAPRDRWTWWTVIRHGRVLRRDPPSAFDPVEAWWEFVFVDAETGAATSRCTTPHDDYSHQPLIEVPCK